MIFYIGVNSDGTEIISKQKLMRYTNFDECQKEVLSFDDTQKPPHWMPDYRGMHVPKNGVFPVDVFLTLPSGAIKKMFNIEMTWQDEIKTVEL